jgi:hypothetical protein
VEGAGNSADVIGAFDNAKDQWRELNNDLEATKVLKTAAERDSASERHCLQELERLILSLGNKLEGLVSIQYPFSSFPFPFAPTISPYKPLYLLYCI